MSDVPIKSANGQGVVDEALHPSAPPWSVSPSTPSEQAVGDGNEPFGEPASSQALGASSLEHLWFDDANVLPDLMDAELDASADAPEIAPTPDNEHAAPLEDEGESAAISFAPVSRGDANEPASSGTESAETGELDRPLVPLCEPLFSDICRLNRIKRLGTPSEMDEPEKIRLRLARRLERLSESARAGGHGAAFATVAGPLRSFVDVVITRGGFSFADNWRPLTPRWADPDRVLLGAAADALCNGDAVETGQLEVLQSCLSLTADLLPATEGQPSGEDLLGAMGRRLTRPSGEHICPGAYDGLFASAILPPIGRQLKVLVAVSLSVLLLTIAIAVALNLRSARELDSSIDVVRHALEPTARPHVSSTP